MESAMKRNDYNLKLVKNTFQDISTLNKQWNINCLKQCLFLSISLSYIAWGSVLISKEIYSKSACQNHMRWWLERSSKVWNRIHGGGIYNVEFLKVFLYILSNTWQEYMPTNNSPGYTQANCRSHRQFFRLVPETPSRFPRWILIEKLYVFRDHARFAD